MRFQRIALQSLLVPHLVALSSLCAVGAPYDIVGVAESGQKNNQLRFVLDDNNFDANVFNPHGNAQKARVFLDTKLKLQMDELNNVCQLTDEQQRKLKLAASLDIKRFFDDVETLRQKVKTDKQDRDAWNKFWQEAQPLRTKLATGLFGRQSFFAKTLLKVLSDEQLAKYNDIVLERQRFRFRSAIESAVTLLETTIPLRASQHEAIVIMLLDETPVPAEFGRQIQFLIQYRLSFFPKERLKSLLDEYQWQLLEIQIGQFRAREQFLVNNGLLTKDEVEEMKSQPRNGKKSAPDNVEDTQAKTENQRKE